MDYTLTRNSMLARSNWSDPTPKTARPKDDSIQDGEARHFRAELNSLVEQALVDVATIVPTGASFESDLSTEKLYVGADRESISEAVRRVMESTAAALMQLPREQVLSLTISVRTGNLTDDAGWIYFECATDRLPELDQSRDNICWRASTAVAHAFLVQGIDRAASVLKPIGGRVRARSTDLVGGMSVRLEFKTPPLNAQ